MQNESFHYYGTSAAEWKVSNDIRELIAHFERSSFPYAIYFVPVDIAADYAIKYYVPQVDGVFCVANITPAAADERKAFGWSKKAA